MEKILYLMVGGVKIRATNSIDITSHSQNWFKCSFTFDAEWTALTGKVAVFTNDKKTYASVNLQQDNTCYIPSAVLKAAGYLYIGVLHSEAQEKLPSEWTFVTVREGVDSGSAPEPPNQSVYIRIMETSEQALDYAREVKERADAGEFDGEPGPQGEPGPEGPAGPQGPPGEGGIFETYGTATGEVSFADSNGHSEGYGSHADSAGVAQGESSHADSRGTAIGEASHAENNSTASGYCSHADSSATASGLASHADSSGYAGGSNAHGDSGGGANGGSSHADSQGVANGVTSHAESHGIANGDSSHAESGSIAQGSVSHAEGDSTLAAGHIAHTEGQDTVAGYGRLYMITAYDDTQKTITLDDVSGLEAGDLIHIPTNGGQPIANIPITQITDTVVALDYNGIVDEYWLFAVKIDAEDISPVHAEGANTIATGGNSHTQNRATIAKGLDQTAIGSYNIPQGTADSKELTDHAFIIGNGSDAENRSNALTVTWAGNLTAAGEIEDGDGNNLSGVAALVEGIETLLAAI